jgi:hypothetical protein
MAHIPMPLYNKPPKTIIQVEKQPTTMTRHKTRIQFYQNLFLIAITILLLYTSLLVTQPQAKAHATVDPGSGNVCLWYTVRAGDTLSGIAWSYQTTIWILAQVNHIANVNLIFVNQQLCIPRRASSTGSDSGLYPNGTVRWYAYDALQWSTQSEVVAQIRGVAARYGLPANLLLAIAWQESGWTQHVIARDGGIGVMQLMPYTAQSINIGTGVRRDPYKLWDNLNLGAIYLSWLWHNFHGNLVEVISAYNEGGWNVMHIGIFNWNYVNNVLYLMRIYS